MQKQLEAFTCAMYDQARESSVNVVRSKLLKKMAGDDQTLNAKSKVDMVRLPLCLGSLIPHVQRVNHHVACYRRAAEPIYERPKPHDKGQGWLKTDEGVVEPVWSIGPILPPSLIDLLDTQDTENDQGQQACVDVEPYPDETMEIDHDDLFTDNEDEF